MKIAIIGNAGSGKSTLGLQLHKMLGLSLYHLDQYFWKPGWQEPDRNEFEKIHNELCDKEAWIIEGCASRFFDYRAKNADIVISLDTSRSLCMFRVIKRSLLGYGKVRFSSAEGCPERLPDGKFLKFVWTFNAMRKPGIEEVLQKYAHEKQAFILKNKLEIKKFLSNVKAEQAR